MGATQLFANSERSKKTIEQSVEQPLFPIGVFLGVSYSCKLSLVVLLIQRKYTLDHPDPGET
jgi:hypothetical protein